MAIINTGKTAAKQIPKASHKVSIPKGSTFQSLEKRAAQIGNLKEKPSILPDPLKVVKEAGAAVGSLAHLKVKKAVQHMGRGVNQITGSAVLQAAFPALAPANVVNGAITGGKKGALKAAQSYLKNPIAKATYGAVGLVFPPLAPLSAGVVAGMEASSRVLDGLESKDPKAVAAAALQFAATEMHAADGVTGAARGLDLLKKTAAARGIAEGLISGNPEVAKAVAETKKLAASGDVKAQAAHHLLTAVTLREASKTSQKSKVHAAARKASPSLLALVQSAMRSPHGVRIGDFSVLRTGRVLHKGKSIPHKPQQKSGKAYEAYAKAHHGRHV